MNTVPRMIGTKDLAYLSDMFEWCFNVGKMANHFSEEANDTTVAQTLKNVAEMEKQHCLRIIQMLGGNGNE